ncbi:hypothetical protein BBR47_37750 [Brevibacillus brevis NBRC 100599]|uniref:Uncharacterized protein n=1 Tax=Brevibacillus brevis (strain 47 / JCM 6285 / NBRC 100599) TaxID=358681 RepID=C0ZG43_BREBN|nr:hypothetical protein BBR47_37750 [Brevibacillus brevis NBRC 100599]
MQSDAKKFFLCEKRLDVFHKTGFDRLRSAKERA